MLFAAPTIIISENRLLVNFCGRYCNEQKWSGRGPTERSTYGFFFILYSYELISFINMEKGFSGAVGSPVIRRDIRLFVRNSCENGRLLRSRTRFQNRSRCVQQEDGRNDRDYNSWRMRFSNKNPYPVPDAVWIYNVLSNFLEFRFRSGETKFFSLAHHLTPSSVQVDRRSPYGGNVVENYRSLCENNPTAMFVSA